MKWQMYYLKKDHHQLGLISHIIKKRLKISLKLWNWNKKLIIQYLNNSNSVSAFWRSEVIFWIPLNSFSVVLDIQEQYITKYYQNYHMHVRN